MKQLLLLLVILGIALTSCTNVPIRHKVRNVKNGIISIVEYDKAGYKIGDTVGINNTTGKIVNNARVKAVIIPF